MSLPAFMRSTKGVRSFRLKYKFSLFRPMNLRSREDRNTFSGNLPNTDRSVISVFEMINLPAGIIASRTCIGLSKFTKEGSRAEKLSSVIGVPVRAKFAKFINFDRGEISEILLFDERTSCLNSVRLWIGVRFVMSLSVRVRDLNFVNVDRGERSVMS